MGSLKKVEIAAILGEEFSKLLADLGVIEGFELGKYQCYVCGKQVNRENVRLIFPLSENEVGFICKKSSCLSKYKETSEQ